MTLVLEPLHEDVNSYLVESGNAIADTLLAAIQKRALAGENLPQSVIQGENGVDIFHYELVISTQIGERSETFKRLKAGLELMGYTQIEIRGYGEFGDARGLLSYRLEPVDV